MATGRCFRLKRMSGGLGCIELPTDAATLNAGIRAQTAGVTVAVNTLIIASFLSSPIAAWGPGSCPCFEQADSPSRARIV